METSKDFYQEKVTTMTQKTFHPSGKKIEVSTIGMGEVEDPVEETVANSKEEMQDEFRDFLLGFGLDGANNFTDYNDKVNQKLGEADAEHIKDWILKNLRKDGETEEDKSVVFGDGKLESSDNKNPESRQITVNINLS